MRALLTALTLATSMGGLQACPFGPNDADYVAGLNEAYARGGLVGMFSSRQLVEDRYRQACGLWKQLIDCGASETLATTLITNYRDMRPVIMDRLANCH